MRHASALKAKRQAHVHQAKNFQVRSQVRNLTKLVNQAIKGKDVTAAKTSFKKAQSAWLRAAQGGVFHKNAANRTISRMASRLSALAKS